MKGGNILKVNKLHTISIIAILFLVFLLPTVVIALNIDLNNKELPRYSIPTRFHGGHGSAEDPYQISNVEQLQEIRENLRANYTLINDIDASATLNWNSGAGFDPLGDNNYNKFTGTLNGQGFNITNLFINCSREDLEDSYRGLFRYVGKMGCVNNVTLINHNISGYNRVGGIVGFNNGIIKNCIAIGNVNAIRYVINQDYENGSYKSPQIIGGLVGYNTGMVINSYVAGNISGFISVGGIIGYNQNGTVIKCSMNGNVSGDQLVGGIVGDNVKGIVTNCLCNGKIGNFGTYKIGGITGRNTGIVSECQSSCNAYGSQFVGGLVGLNQGEVSKCNINCNVYGCHIIGGLVGHNRGIILNCSANGNISATGSQIGGLVGVNNNGKIKDCYAIGKISGNERIGGLVGDNYYNNKIENSFYCINDTLLNGNNLITPYGIYRNQFNDWMSNAKILNIEKYLKKNITTAYYEIITVSDLKNMLPFSSSQNHHFKQFADIDLSTEYNFYIPVFQGYEYDGNNFSILNLSISIPVNNKIGLFGYVESDTKLIDLSCINCNIIGNQQVGGLVGMNYGTINNCYVSGNVSGTSAIGGLVGYNNGTISKCHTLGKVSADGTVGGLVGFNSKYAMISDCLASSNVIETYIGTFFSGTGGLLGRNDGGTVINCYATGKVSGDNCVGGLVGETGDDEGVLENCYSTGNVYGVGNKVGGLVGSNYKGIVLNCSAFGNVHGNDRVGGLVGCNQHGTIKKCYANGNVTGNNYVGSLIGENNGTISNCHATGNVSSNKSKDDNGYTGFSIEAIIAVSIMVTIIIILIFITTKKRRKSEEEITMEQKQRTQRISQQSQKVKKINRKTN